jgi:hypothetical protein
MTDLMPGVVKDDSLVCAPITDGHAQPSPAFPRVAADPTSESTPGGVQEDREDPARPQPRRGRRRARRSFGSVERLPSGRFRARVIGPDGRYVSAPTTFTSRTDASVWVDVQHADLVRGTWRAPVRPSASPTVGAYVGEWIEQHPTARDSTKELYRGLPRTCRAPGLGPVAVSRLPPPAVRGWHHRLGERLAADAQARQQALVAAGRATSAASVRDGRPR